MYDKELKYNFYNILAVKSGVDQGLHFIYEGQANEPNIVLSDNKELRNYVCKNLYVFSNKEDSDGEMIIENECTCNYGKKIYLRVLLNTERMMPSNEIDKLFENNHVEIDLNNVLHDEDDCVYTETNDGILITFKHPVNVHSKFKDLPKNPIFNSKPTASLFEGFEVVAIPDSSGNFVDAEGNRVSYDVSGDSYMVCDNLPIDAPVVPMYNVDVNRTYDNRVSEVLAITSISIFFVMVLILWFSMNYIYRFLAGFAGLIFTQDSWEEVITNVNKLEAIGFILLFSLIIILPSISGETNENFVQMLMYSVFIVIFLAVFTFIAKTKKQNEDLFGIPSQYEVSDESVIQDCKDKWANTAFLWCTLKYCFGNPCSD